MRPRPRCVAASTSWPTSSTAGWRRPAPRTPRRSPRPTDGTGLDAAAATFTDLGFDLFAAEAQAAAASAHGAAGHRAAAHASAERARRLATACEGASTPLLRRLAAPEGPGDLTPRERETAELAARGHTDREIAEALFLSIRTVHAHLRSAYAKLGVPGRTGLAEVLGIRPDSHRRPRER